MLRINDPQKHKVFYTWELYDVMIDFQCAYDHIYRVCYRMLILIRNIMLSAILDIFVDMHDTS